MQTTQTDNEVLKRARALERQTREPWTWFDVRCSPGQLTRLVIEGKVKIVGKRWRSKLYRVA